MKIIVIIQARMGSYRLPGKVLRALGETEVIDYVVTRSREIQGVAEVIVATSKRVQDDPIAAWCAVREIPCFRGSEDDVLARYYDCARKYNPDYVIRVTADNPFLDYLFANKMVEAVKSMPTDVVTVEGPKTLGFFVELVSFSCLEFINSNGLEARHREHVTCYAYENISQFRHISIKAPAPLGQPELRVTLDTEEDYHLLQLIAQQFPGDKLVCSKEVVDYLKSNPDIAAINAHINQKPVV